MKKKNKAEAGRAPVCWDASEQESNFLKREVVFRLVFFLLRQIRLTPRKDPHTPPHRHTPGNTNTTTG